MADDRPRGYLRDREDEDSARASFAELFFDLVFVFAIIQLSAYLAANLTAEGIVRGLLLLGALWWFWINTTWAMNRLDPDRGLVRAVIFGLMGVGLMLSVSLTGAFGDRGAVFAGAYVLMQVGRSAFMVWVLEWHGEEGQRETFVRVTLWFAISGALWIGGALAEGDSRVVLWAVALILELVVPWFGFWLPRLGRTSARAWDIESEHLTERCALFIILALGESILVSGGRMVELEWHATTLASFGLAFLSLIAMWWIYFDSGARRGIRAFERSAEPGRLARFAYTYVHLPIVAGVVAVAVGDKLLLAHPEDPVDAAGAFVILGGPALFLLGNFLFKNATNRRWPLSHVIGLALLAGPMAWLGAFSLLGLSAWAVAALIAVAVAERLLLQSRGAARAGVN